MFIYEKKHEYWWYLIISVLVFFSFYFAIGAYPLFDNNEGLYASIAKEMLLSRDFIIPHLNGVPYIEKPPLLYWLLTASFSIFGFTAFAARLVTVTSATLVCIVMLYFTKKIHQTRVGILGSVIFASSVGISIIARMVYFDMLFTLLVSSALLCLFYWYEYQKANTLRLGYLFFGLAILAKGLVAVVLIGGSFGAFFLLERDFRKLYRILDPLGIALFLAIILPWHIAAIIKHQGFAWRYFIEEHFLRFINQREPHDYYHGSIYYYLPRILIYLFPWSFFVPLIFLRTTTNNATEKTLLNFCWCWFLIPLLFFSLSSAKANYYMVVSTPALAIILGIKIVHYVKEAKSRFFGIWSAIVLFIVSLILGVLYFIFGKALQLDRISSNVIFITMISFFIGVLVMINIVRYQELSAVILSLFIVPAMMVMVSYIKVVKGDLSTANAGQYLTMVAKDSPLYIYQDFENISALFFYVTTRFKVIDSRSNDLYYGERLPGFKQWFVTRSEFLHDTMEQKSFIVVPVKKLPQFYHEMAPRKFSLLESFNKVVILKSR